MGACGPTNGTKFNFLWIPSTSGKMMMSCFLMESELPGIILVKVVTKNILLGSLETQHQAVFCNVMSLFEETQSFWTKLLHLSVDLVKQYTSLIYVKEKSLCLVNLAFPLWVPKNPFHAVKLQKYFIHMRVKSAKNLLEKHNLKEDSAKTTISHLSAWHVEGS